MLRALLLLAVLFCTACASSGGDPFISLARKCDAAPGASTCAAAGDYLWENTGKKLRPCKSAQGVACQRAGEDTTDAIRRIDKLAAEYNDRACLFGAADACNKAGVSFAVESTVAPESAAADLARYAEERFERACKLGSKDGCRNVGSTKPAR